MATTGERDFMTESTAATPWKWDWRQIDGENDCGIYRIERPGQAISVCRAPRYVTRKQWEETATKIVRAVNSFDALVEALEALVSVTRHECPEIYQAKAALLLAKGEK
jgi:hypothetical protein